MAKNTLTAFEAKTRFGELLERVAAGEEIVITRHDTPVARVILEGTSRRRNPKPAWMRWSTAPISSCRGSPAAAPQPSVFSSSSGFCCCR